MTIFEPVTTNKQLSCFQNLGIANQMIKSTLTEHNISHNCEYVSCIYPKNIFSYHFDSPKIPSIQVVLVKTSAGCISFGNALNFIPFFS